MIFNWLRSRIWPAATPAQQSFDLVEQPLADLDDSPTTQKEMAKALLVQMTKRAVFGRIGGKQPEKSNREHSWWGGNFLAAVGEDVPVCTKTGRAMHPVLQIKVDELPETPEGFADIALLTFWMDLESTSFWGAKDEGGFCIRTYPSLDGLVPLGFGFRESTALPSFQVYWDAAISQHPSWEDIAFELPSNVAQAMDADWFFDSRYAENSHTLQQDHPITLGGWPTWIQGADWPKNSTYYFQIDSTLKGKLGFGDSGSIYLFKTTDGWEMRGDCY